MIGLVSGPRALELFALIGRQFRPRPSGSAWAGPSYVSSGAGSFTSSGTQSVPYPSSPANNDLILLSATAHVGTVSTPSGFTLEENDTNSVSERHYIFSRRSNGTESGSITLTSSSTFTVARMYLFRNVALSSYKEAHNAQGNNAGPNLTSLGVSRLAVCMQGGYGSTPDAITGASGGAWSLITSYRDASTMCLSLHVCQLPAATTISGGASTSYGECVGQGLILKA